MFDFLLHPYMRWLRGRSQDNRPDFNIDRDDLPPQTLAQRTVDFPTPESEASLPSAPPTGLTGFAIEQPNEIPGFHVGLRDDVPGLNLNENNVPRRENTWPDGAETAAPESSEAAQTSPLPPGVEEPGQSSPQLPEWLHNLLAMPLPQLSTAFDPRTGRRIVPYEPLINWTRPYSAADKDVRGTEAGSPDVTKIGALPGLPPIEAPARQTAFLTTPGRPADLNTHPAPAAAQSANAPPIVQEVRWNPWPQPLSDGQTHVQTSDVDPGDPWRASVQQLPQQTPLPQEQQARLNNAPEIAFGKDLAGIPPTSRIGAPPIENAVYNPDVDPGLDDLFDLIGVKENRAQGNAARDDEEARIERENPGVKIKKEIRIYVKGGPEYMTADIVLRPNGIAEIIITEVKSGNAKLTANQVKVLSKAASSGEIYIVNEDAAKKFDIRPYQTFASRGIIPIVHVVGGNVGAIAKQLGNEGLDVRPEGVRRGLPPRLRVGPLRPL